VRIILSLCLILNIHVALVRSSDNMMAQGTRPAAGAQAQQAPARKGTSFPIQLGAKSIAIPSPEGFDEAASQLELVKRFFAGTEDPNLDMLAVHLPIEDIERLRRGERFDLPFYTKISISKRNREADYSAADFSALVSHMQASGAKVFDFDSPEMKAKAQSTNKSLSELLEQETTMDITQPVNLGVIEQTPNSYAILFVIKVKFQSGGVQKEKLVASSATFARINQRLIYIYTYRLVNSKDDIDILKRFTKQWVSQILRANGV
jgi:hypothetical protein